MKKILLIVLFIFSVSLTFAGLDTPDSLLLHKIDSIQKILLKSDLTEEHETELLYDLAYLYYDLEETTQALIHSKHVLNKYKAANDLQNIAKTLDLIGRIYFYLSDYDSSLDILLQAQSIYEEIGDEELINRGKYTIGTFYNEIDNKEEAYRYLKEAEEFLRKDEKKNAGEIRSIYNSYGIINERKNQSDSSLYFYKKAIIFSEKYMPEENIGNLLINIGIVYIKKKD